MPLFCTLATQYAGTNTPPANKFENRGYPLMFERKNKHMFFLDPEDTTKTVQKFYGAPLSVAHGALCCNPSLPSAQQYYNSDTGDAIDIFGPNKSFEVDEPTSKITFGGTFRMFKKIVVNDHKIDVVSTRVQVQNETQLSVALGNVTNNTLSHGGNFQVITGLNVQDHNITPNYNQFTLPTETPVTITDVHAADDYPDNGGNFRIVYNIRKLLSDGSHVIRKYYNDVYLPEFDLKLLNSSGNNVNYSSNPLLYYIGEPTLEFGFTSNGIWSSIKKIKFVGAHYYANKDYLSIDVNTDVYHAAEHAGAIYNVTSNSVSTKQVRLANGDFYGAKETKLFSIYVDSSMSVSYTGTNDLSFTAKHGSTHEAALSGTTMQITKNGISGTSTTNLWTIKSGTGINVSGSGTELTISNTSLNSHYSHGITVTSGKSKITDSSSDIANLVTWQTGTANNVGPVYDIKVVSALPSDAGLHPNTLYLVTGGG